MSRARVYINPYKSGYLAATIELEQLKKRKIFLGRRIAQLEATIAHRGAENMNPVMIEILNAGQLLVSFIVLGEGLALKIKSHFELDPDFSVNVKTLSGDALNADDATMDEINKWRQSVGLDPLPKSS